MVKMGLPSAERLSYWKLLLETVLIVLVVPLLILALFKNPHHAVEHAISKVS